MEHTAFTSDLFAENTRLNTRVTELENVVTELSALVKHFEELFRLSQIKRFGSSSEKTSVNGQVSMFEITAPEIITALPVEHEEIKYIRRKRVGKREADLSKLPLEIIEHELPETERKCPECSGNVIEIGVQTRDELKIIPAQVIRLQHRAKTYKCPECADNTEKTPIIKATMPAPLIKGSIASASAVSHIMTQKHLMHLPFYRLEQDFQRQGVAISRQTMSNWTIQVCEDWLSPVYSAMKVTLLQRDVLHADETSVQVLNEPGKAAETKSYMWLYRTSSDASNSIVLYDYQPGRGGQYPDNFLRNWHGYLHADGYSSYRMLQNVTLIGCWAHLRRKFDEAAKISKDKNSAAKIGLDYCNRLFALERDFADLSSEERHESRQTQSLPLAEAFFAWVKIQNFPPKLAITRALNYAQSHEDCFMNVFLDGRFELSNNRAERSIKPFVLGRKNWLFCNSVRGAKASAVAFSIIETAKENGLKPFEYLKFLLESLPNANMRDLDALLPWGIAVPDECRMK